MAGLTLSGVAPPAIGDNRRQLPGNAPVLQPGVLPPSVAAYGAPSRAGHSTSGYGSGTAAAQSLPGGVVGQEDVRYAGSTGAAATGPLSLDGAVLARGLPSVHAPPPAVASWVASSRPSYDGMTSTRGAQDFTSPPGEWEGM